MKDRRRDRILRALERGPQTTAQLADPECGGVRFLPANTVESVPTNKSARRCGNSPGHGTEGVTSMQGERTSRQRSMDALAAAGLGHISPGPYGDEAVAQGLCSCGCGQTPRLAPKTATKDRWLKGRPVPTIFEHRNRIPLPDRFVVDETTDCWIWQGAAIKGYPVTRVNGRPTVKAFRWLYEELHGPIAEGLVPDHLCRVTMCVNPAHIEPVTVAENTRRGSSATLTAEKVVEIRRLAGTMPQHEIARRYGVTQATISRAVLGKAWAA